jgi:hypothetical protein
MHSLSYTASVIIGDTLDAARDAARLASWEDLIDARRHEQRTLNRLARLDIIDDRLRALNSTQPQPQP